MAPRSGTLIRLALVVVWVLSATVIGAYFPINAAAIDGCRPEPITANTPTGIAGCEVWGTGTGSHYGPGYGVAMNFCTWVRRHNEGCGFVTISSADTGSSATVPVVDFCDCYTGTPNQRVVDMQYGVLDMLGLSRSAGLYVVTVTPAGGPAAPQGAAEPPVVILPDTAMEQDDE